MEPSNSNPVYLVGENIIENTVLQIALKELNLVGKPCDLTLQSSFDFTSKCMIIFDDFSGPFFESCRKKVHINPELKVFGVPAIVHAAKSPEKLEPLMASTYPLYSCLLGGSKFSITGMRSKDRVIELRRKLLYLGGVYVEKGVQVNYLIVERVGGERYRDACTIGIPTIKVSWIDFIWEKRCDPRFDWANNLVDWKCKAFYSLQVAFEGFDADTKSKMMKCLDDMEGTFVEASNPFVTHIVRKPPQAECSNHLRKPSSPNPDDFIFRRPIPMDQSSEGMAADTFHTPVKRPRVELDVVFETPEPPATPSGRIFGKEKVKVVKDEWFWTTLQVEYCAFEEPYLLDCTDSLGFVKQSDDFHNGSISSPVGIISPQNYTLPLSDTDGGTPTSSTAIDGGSGSANKRKRKRGKDCLRSEVLSSLLLPDLPPKIIEELQVGDQSINLGGKSLDTVDQITDQEFAGVLKQVNDYLANADYKSWTARQAEFSHLVETERNYVTILMNIVKNFKEPCENPDQAGGRILDTLEVKTIFGSILPIYAVHRRILRDLMKLRSSWSEDVLIGKVYCDHANDLKKAYEPYINYYEASKEEIIRCETLKPRFLAFLRIAQGRPECAKQSLIDLMIRPVQRLPSTGLILSALMKRTKEPNPDAAWLQKACDALNGVNKAINEGKRMTEARTAIFDIYNEVDGFPVELVSAGRSFLQKFNIQTMWDLRTSQKHELITMFVFNDSIVLAKRKSAVTKHLSLANSSSVVSLRSPSLSRKSIMPGSQYSYSAPKPYKFLQHLYHLDIVRVIEVISLPFFGLAIRAPHENRDTTFKFTLQDDPTWPKDKFFHFLAKLAADAVDRLDWELKLTKMELSDMEYGYVPMSNGSVMGKAHKLAARTGKKVSRAFSLSRTPSKLKRTVSQMMSPFSSKN